MNDGRPPNARSIVAAGIRSHRAARNWSQAVLAQRVGWNQATISNAETRDRGIEVNDLFLFAEAFDIPVIDLFREATPAMRRRLLGPRLAERLEL